MSEDKLAAFVKKKRKVEDKTLTIPIDEGKKVPWYLRPIEREAFTVRKGKDGKFYAQHNEWSKRTWIGPYKTQKEVDSIIDSYVYESLKCGLDKKAPNSIHSICVEEMTFKTFFE